MKFSYPLDADTVYQFVTNPEIVRRRSEAFGETEIRIDVSGSTITNTRKVQAQVPGFAKRLLSPVNTVVDTKVWDPQQKRARLMVDIHGAPVKVEGNIQIVPTPTGCDYVVDFQVSCKIPLIGGQLAKYVTGLTEEGMRKEHDWNRATLGQAAR